MLLPPGAMLLRRLRGMSMSSKRLWSLIASCERHGVDPQRYLTSVLAKIGSTPADDLEQFLPVVWKAEDAAEPTSHR